MTASAELIVLAAPPHDAYYAEVADDILDFHAGFAKKIIEAGDDVLILVNKKSAPRYQQRLGSGSILIAPMDDIWMRDFAWSNAANPVLFRYTAAAQGSGRKGQRDADYVQGKFVKQMLAGLSYRTTKLLNDGGNLVDDYHGNVVLSTKFLTDNDLDETDARRAIQKVTGAKHVAFIDADEQGGLEHADGVVSFIDENTLIVNDYREDPAYENKLHADLNRGLPGVKIHRIVTPYDGSVMHDKRFGSACGLYTNALVTPKRIYLPQFGIPEDKQALATVRALTKKQVVPVSSKEVCHMGGGVRCMSWQLRGDNAKILLEGL